MNDATGSARSGAETDPDEIRRILEERAARLAIAPEEEDDGERVTLVVLGVGDERYGVPIERVRDIQEDRGVTPLPATPPFWAGVVNLRGELAPLLDLGRYLGLGPPSADGPSQIALLHGAGTTIAVRVDEVVGVRAVPLAEIGPPLVDEGGRSDAVTGLTDDLVCVVDVDRLLGDRALVVQEGFDIS